MSISTKSDPRWAALALIVTAQFMVILDVAIVNVALPSIKTDLDFSQTNLQWVISAYAIFFGGALLLGGRLGDLLGRRRLFVAGLALFSASSLLCGLAWSEASLIGFRALQGLGGALLAPAALSLLMTTFAEGRERNLALGIYGAASGSGAAVGVLLGGLLTSYLSWSWIFFINVPVGIAAIALTPVLLRESRADVSHRHFDFPGAASDHRRADAARLRDDARDDRRLGRRLDARAARRRRSPSSARSSLIELRSPAPLLPLRIFRLRTLTGANAAMAIVGAVAFSEFFLLTLYLQDVLHYSAVESGVAFIGFALTVVVISNVAQVVVGRFGVRPTLTAGLLVSAALRRVADAAAGRRAVLLGSLPRLRPRRRRDGALVRPRDDREPHRRRALRRRRRLRPHQHEPPDRRRDRHRRGERDRRHVDAQLRGRPRRHASSAVALDHGFQTALYVLTGLLLVGAVIAVTLVKPAPVAGRAARAVRGRGRARGRRVELSRRTASRTGPARRCR